MALHFLIIDGKRNTMYKLYIMRRFVIYTCMLQKTTENNPKMHPETHQNLTKDTLEKTVFWGINFDMVLTPKMSQA